MIKNEGHTLIVSTPIDISTFEVIDWLKEFNQSFILINSVKNISGMSLRFGQSDNFELKINKGTYSVSDLKSLWYRKGDINIDLISPIKKLPEMVQRSIFDHLEEEWELVKKKIFRELEEKSSSLSDFNHAIQDKIEILNCAQQVGLNIPDTLITTSKKELSNFLNEHQMVITKNIQDILVMGDSNSTWSSYTELIDENLLACLPETFFPSLFQQGLSKRCELRIFFIENEYYPMAIFSSTDSQTEIDYRRYNSAKPNRNVPFNLPIEIKEKLNVLMSSISLKSGSIDMIYTEDKEYYFIEVNPAGQFGMVSTPCNYQIEKEIAKYLSSYESE